MSTTPAQPPQPPWSQVRSELERLLDLDPRARASALEDLRSARPDVAARVQELLTSSKLTGLNAEAGEAMSALASEITPAAPAPGQTVGRFTLVRMIGAGGMGAVYEADDAQLGRRVALKFVWGGPRGGSALRRFQAEARTLARLRHPGIAQVYDVGSWEQPVGGPMPGVERVPFIAMEFVPGAAPITEHAGSRRLGFRARLSLLAAALDAVHEAHQRGVIHRDLKPANILVDESGNPKIIDFGIARILDAAGPDAAAASTTANASGTLRYMSPESLQAGPGEAGPDARADLYALGVVLYELLEQAAPFRHADTATHPSRGSGMAGVADLVREIRTGSWRTPGLALVDDAAARADLRAVIARAMALDPADRYESVAAFAADLRRVLAREPVLARPPGLWREARSLARRHRPTAFAAVFAALALAAGAAAAWSGLVQARRALALKERESQRLQRSVDFFRGVMLAANPTLPVRDGHASPGSAWILGPPLGPPLEVRGAGATLVESLSWAADRVDAQFADDPELRARIQFQVGNDLGGVYQLRRSLELLRGAHRDFLAALGPDHPDTLRAQVALASSIDMGPDEALSLLRDALPRLARLLGEDDVRLDHVVSHMADRLRVVGRLDEALDLIDRRARLVESREGPGSVRFRSLEAFRAHLALEAPDEPARARARERLAQLHRELVDQVGEDHPATISVATFNAMVPGADPEASLALLRRAEAATIRAYGPASNAVHELRSMLARALMYRGDLAGAEAVLRAQLDAARQVFGESGYATCKTKGFLARVLTWAGKDLPEAQRLAHEAANDAMAHVDTGRAGDWEAWFYAIEAKAVRLRGDPARAEAMLRELVALRSAGDKAHWCDAYILTQLAEALLDQGRADEARDTLERARTRVEAMNDPEAPITHEWRRAAARAGQSPGPPAGSIAPP